MTFQACHACGGCAVQKGLVQRFIIEEKRDIHARTIRGLHVVAVQAAVINRIVEQFGLCIIHARHRFQAAICFEPFKHQTRTINCQGRWRVEHRIIVRHVAPSESRRTDGLCAIKQVVTHDHKGQPRWANVFLRTAINHAVAADVDGA